VWNRQAGSKTPHPRNGSGARADFGAGPRPRDHFTALEVTPMGFKISLKDELDDMLDAWVKDIRKGT
jgi:hypothetical protein